MPPFGLRACVHAVNASFFRARRDGRNGHSATSRCQVVQTERNTRAEAGCSHLSVWWRLLLRAEKPKKEIQNKSQRWWRQSGAKHPKTAAAAAAHTLWLCPFGSIYNGGEAHFKARRPHTGRKLNPAATDDIIELLNERTESGGSSAGRDYTTRSQWGPALHTGGSLLCPNITTALGWTLALSFFHRITLEL